jgi:hypothetical protein
MLQPMLALTRYILFLFNPCNLVLFNVFFNLTALNPFEDFKTHAALCDELLQHYTQQFRDREIYWMSREYSRSHEGLITVIIDSYDKAKLSLPRWPFGRVPKKSIYEETRRCLIILETFLFKKKKTYFGL